MIIFCLLLSVLMQTIRNLKSKNIADLSFGTKSFFKAQFTIFVCGSIAMAAATGNPFKSLAPVTVLYAVIYGSMLLSAQYCYTAALKNGNVGICSTVYSLGFVLPTLSGSLFWDEKLTVFNIIGILLVIPAVLISGYKPSNAGKKAESNSYIIPLVIAMLSSGGLGIMQKVQQSSSFPEQKNSFIVISFAFAAVVSLVLSLIVSGEKIPNMKKKLVSAGILGIAFASANLLNTFLSGQLDSAVFYPTLNICTILASLICGVLLYREKISKKDVAVVTLGVLSIIFIAVL